MTKIWTWLDGHKTWIAVVLSVVISVLSRRGVEIPPWIFDITDGILGLGLGHKALKWSKALVAKTPETPAAAPLLLLVLFLGACGTTPAAGASPSTAGAPSTAGQLAQTVAGQQGQAPSTATGGTAAVNWYFASSVPSEVAAAILKIAGDNKWTAEQLAAVLQSTSGAPQTVHITTTGNSAAGGNASSIPAGTGGTAGVGGAGTVERP